MKLITKQELIKHKVKGITIKCSECKKYRTKVVAFVTQEKFLGSSDIQCVWVCLKCLRSAVKLMTGKVE